MKLKVEQPVALICTFVWIGFISAISFLEAWMKFKAPGVTIPIGLSIGRLVFGALNKIEWVFTIAIIVSMYVKPAMADNKTKIPFILTVLLLLTQTIWLLPALDIRAQMHINGQNVPHSNLHIYYVTVEVIKVCGLLLFGIKLFKTD